MKPDCRRTISVVQSAVVATVWLAVDPGCVCEAPRTEIPSIRVPRARRTPTMDGDLSDWPPEAARTEPFVDTMTGAPVSDAPSARMLWDERGLYVALEVRDPLLRASGRERDAHLWEEDCVEIMLDPDGDGQRYIELQVSPRNVVFDTWFDTYRAPAPFGHVDWSSGIQTAVRVRGTVDDDRPDEGYDVEIAVPWTALVVAGRSSEAPRAGETFRLQMYLLDARENGQRGLGWSAPLVGDFHVPARFGHVTFEAP